MFLNSISSLIDYKELSQILKIKEWFEKYNYNDKGISKETLNDILEKTGTKIGKTLDETKLENQKVSFELFETVDYANWKEFINCKTLNEILKQNLFFI